MLPKVAGTLVLDRALRDVALDFFVMFSSLSSVTGGGPGQVDYCAANAFLDAFAQTRAARRGTCVAISWDQWQWDAWQDSLWGFPEEARNALIDRRRRYGISFEEGCEALDRILSRRLPHVLVAPRDFRQIAKESRNWSVSAVLEQLRLRRQSQPKYPRPELGCSYVAPSTTTEQKVAALWEELLSIEQVGVDDDFFELGGDSLMGIRLIARVREEFRTDAIPAHVFFESPTVHTLARALGDTPRPAEPPQD
jgi:acyl carrier protein